MQNDQAPSAGAGRPQHPLLNYQFSPEEMRVLRECDEEAFYQRCLPIGSILGMGTYLGIKQGYLTASVKYGAAPKVIIGTIIGYFIGKISYRRKCIEKFMRLPNSRLGELLRQYRDGKGFGASAGLYGFGADSGLGLGTSLNPFGSNDVYSDEHLQPNRQSSSLNLDVESRPTFAGLDDIYRPTLDSPVVSQVDTDIPLDPVKPGMTYEELRQQNREEYAKKHRQKTQTTSSNMSSNILGNAAISESGPTSSTSLNFPDHQSSYNRRQHSTESVTSQRTNKYGDLLGD